MAHPEAVIDVEQKVCVGARIVHHLLRQRPDPPVHPLETLVCLPPPPPGQNWASGSAHTYLNAKLHDAETKLICHFIVEYAAHNVVPIAFTQKPANFKRSLSEAHMARLVRRVTHSSDSLPRPGVLAW